MNRNLNKKSGTISTKIPLISSYTPSIIEEREHNVAEIDIFSRLLADRILFLGGPIDDYIANVTQAQLLYLASVSDEPIKIYINSPGGTVYDGLAIYDTMQYIPNKIETYCVGLAASMGAVLLSAGTPGHRNMLKHSRVMIHQPLGGTYGQATDIEIDTKQILELKSELIDILSVHTGKDYETVRAACERDYWMNSKHALEFGIVDNIIQ